MITKIVLVTGMTCAQVLDPKPLRFTIFDLSWRFAWSLTVLWPKIKPCLALSLSTGWLRRWLNCREFACQCRRLRSHGLNPSVEKIPWRREWQPTPVFLPGKFHGQRSLMGYSPSGRKESDTTEWLNTHKPTAFWLISLLSHTSSCSVIISWMSPDLSLQAPSHLTQGWWEKVVLWSWGLLLSVGSLWEH